MKRSWLRWLELVLLFLVSPIVLDQVHHGMTKVPVIPLLVVVGLSVVLSLLRDPSFAFREALALRWNGREARRILALFALGTVLLTAATATFFPDRFLELPRQRPQLWFMIMVFYPLVSVLPQELFFRVFFFHRYAPLLGDGALLTVVCAVAFGLAHLMFGTALAVVLSGVGGALFSITFARSQSLWLASFEHGLYGCLIFTVGLGRFFYAG